MQSIQIDITEKTQQSLSDPPINNNRLGTMRNQKLPRNKVQQDPTRQWLGCLHQLKKSQVVSKVARTLKPTETSFQLKSKDYQVNLGTVRIILKFVSRLDYQ